MKKLVIFDLDGTLLNTIADLAHSTNYALNKLGYPTHEIEKYNFMVGNGIDKLFERALPEGEKSKERMYCAYARNSSLTMTFIMPMTAALIPVFRNYSHTYRMQVFKLLWLPTNIRQPPKS